LGQNQLQRQRYRAVQVSFFTTGAGSAARVNWKVLAASSTPGQIYLNGLISGFIV
jgi:hypothetical protein